MIETTLDISLMTAHMEEGSKTLSTLLLFHMKILEKNL